MSRASSTATALRISVDQLTPAASASRRRSSCTAAGIGSRARTRYEAADCLPVTYFAGQGLSETVGPDHVHVG
ncbi:hypothetical protein, partial [Nocardia sp. NPDC003672]